jgi:hypothetical protein
MHGHRLHRTRLRPTGMLNGVGIQRQPADLVADGCHPERRSGAGHRATSTRRGAQISVGRAAMQGQLQPTAGANERPRASSRARCAARPAARWPPRSNCRACSGREFSSGTPGRPLVRVISKPPCSFSRRRAKEGREETPSDSDTTSLAAEEPWLLLSVPCQASVPGGSTYRSGRRGAERAPSPNREPYSPVEPDSAAASGSP